MLNNVYALSIYKNQLSTILTIITVLLHIRSKQGEVGQNTVHIIIYTHTHIKTPHTQRDDETEYWLQLGQNRIRSIVKR